MTATPSKHGETLMRTTDLTLAAYLQVKGYEPDLVDLGEEVKAGQPQGAWEFDETPALRALVDAFNAHEASVEPQALHTMINRTRRELFAFLRIGGTQ